MEISALPDIAMMSTVMAQNRTLSDVGTALMSQTLEDFKTQGAELTKMMELSVNPGLGANFDMSV